MTERSTKPRKLAVIGGATGYLGGHVAVAAHRAGYRVRALARDEAGLAGIRDACDEVFVGEATKPETLEGLFEGASIAFSSIGLRSVARRPTLWEVDAGANLNLVEEAERAGVDRFVFVSVLGAPAHRRDLPVAEARERVVDRLRASTTLRSSIIRPSGFYNDMLEVLEMARGGRVWLVGDGQARFNPIHGADLADACVEAFADPERHTERDVGGPEVLTLDEVAALAEETLHRPVKRSSVPAWIMRAAGAIIAPFNINASSLLRMFAVMGQGDLVAPAHGTHTLAPFFAEHARSGEHASG